MQSTVYPGAWAEEPWIFKFPAYIGSWELEYLTQRNDSGTIFKSGTGKSIQLSKTLGDSNTPWIQPLGNGDWFKFTRIKL